MAKVRLASLALGLSILVAACSVGGDDRRGERAAALGVQTPAATPGVTRRTIVDSVGNVGGDTAVTIGADGLALIGYRDYTNGDLKVAHCSNVSCTQATSTTVDSTANVGQFTSIVIGTDGFGLISYYDLTNDDLKVAHCTNAACSAATSATVDSAGTVGWDTSIIISTHDGFGLISYYDATNQDLKVAHCSNVSCSQSTTAAIQTAGNVGRYSSMAALPAAFQFLISYYDDTNGDLKVAHCSVSCATATSTTVDSVSDIGTYTSITIGSDGRGLISYRGPQGSLKVAHCSNSSCSLSTESLVGGGSGQGSSITIGADGLGLIVFPEAASAEVHHCVDLTCSDTTSKYLNLSPEDAVLFSVTVGSDGLPLLAYYESIADNLVVAHCANAFCVPYFQRR